MSGKNLLLLFDRPNEPVYVPKGDKKVVLDVPENYLPAQYQPVAKGILSRFGGDSLSSVPIKQITIPDLSIPMGLGRRDAFSLFIPAHQVMSSRLIEIFMGMRTVDDLLSLAAYCRDRINSQMFIYALSVAILHRPDTKDITLPQMSEIFPEKYLDSSIFSRAKEEANVIPLGSRLPIEIPLDYTATDADPEHRVAYWREDIGVNLHHWHWHLVYPFNGPQVVVNKDRRGELFYYMHHQIMARYNTERMCNNLARVRRLTNLRDPIPEAYFPKLDQIIAGRSWPSRPANFSLSDIDRKSDQLKVDIADLERFRDRIYEAIHTRSARTQNNSSVPLDDFTGIDILGNMLEASLLSPNHKFYGDFHNFGHLLIAYSHDPDHRYLENFGVMGDSATAMRDPVFYKWHAFIDSVFTDFKDSLQPYNVQQLVFPGVTVSSIHINTSSSSPDTLNTHWTKSDLDLSRGLDFTPRGPIFARFQHINHDFFSYIININNANNQQVIGTIRIFITPKFDETGRTLTFNDQRMLMIEMDKFSVTLERGPNIITRNSVDSSVTIPFEATFRNVSQDRPDESNVQSSDQLIYCGCGWPQHMMVPKGTKHGYEMDMFVMVSNYELDRVDQIIPARECRDGISICGLRGLKYPDARSMGYPFDRIARQGVNSLNDFLTPNMAMQSITVKFSEQIKARQSCPRKSEISR